MPVINETHTCSGLYDKNNTLHIPSQIRLGIFLMFKRKDLDLIDYASAI